MRSKIVVALFFCVGLLCLAAPAVPAETYTVEWVIDGKTIMLTNGQEVRLIGVQVPDDAELGREAGEFLKRYLSTGKEIELEFDVQETGDDGCLLAYGFAPIEKSLLKLAPDISGWIDESQGYRRYFLNATMIYEGYATPLTTAPNIKYADLFTRLYQEARDHKRGLWRDKSVTEGVYLYDRF